MIDPVSVLLPVIRGGWKVFPITAGAKKPPLILDFPNSASGDITQIQAWATQHVGCNWAVSLSMSNVFCLDLDGTAGGRWLAAQEKVGAFPGHVPDDAKARAEERTSTTECRVPRFTAARRRLRPGLI